jgi:hypothetical protein
MRFFRQMLAARISRFHPDPVAALEAAAVRKRLRMRATGADQSWRGSACVASDFLA